jgi:uncharacterized membrane protein YkoI
MTLSRRLLLIGGLLAVIALAVGAITMASTSSSAQTTPPTAADDHADGETNDDIGAAADAGRLDDGADLLSQASITVDEAIAAAKTAASGDIGEIDLEDYHGKLAFNVDVGDQDVKVDAATGEVLGSGSD